MKANSVICQSANCMFEGFHATPSSFLVAGAS